MIRGEVELVADTMLINKICLIEYGIQKNAGFADTLLGMTSSGFSTIHNAAAEEVKNSAATPVESVTRMVMDGMLFTIWRPLYIINGIAKNVFDVDLLDLMKKMWSKALNVINNKGSISSQEMSGIARGEVEKIANNKFQGKVISRDLFEPLRTAEQKGQLYHLISEADWFGSNNRSTNYSSRSSNYGTPGTVKTVWDFLTKLPVFKGRSVVGAFAGWALRALVIGAGLTIISGTATRLLGINKETTPIPSASNEDGTIEVSENYESAPSNKLTPTGRGQDRHKNDHQNSKWIVPLVNNSVDDTLVAWAEDIYKELVGKENEIKSCPSFNKTVSEIERALEPENRSKVVLPSKYKTRKQVVDQFAADVAITAPKSKEIYV